MANRTKLTAKKREEFLEALEETGNVSASAKAIGLSRVRMYEIRHEDPEFKARWDEAVEVGVDALEQEARRRAYHGTTKPVYQGGALVGEIQEYSDTLMIFLLKGKRRQIFGDKREVTGKDGCAIQHKVEKVDYSCLSDEETEDLMQLSRKLYGNAMPSSRPA